MGEYPLHGDRSTFEPASSVHKKYIRSWYCAASVAAPPTIAAHGGFILGVSGIAKCFVLDRHREAVGRNGVQFQRLQDDAFTSHVEYHRLSWIGRNVSTSRPVENPARH